MGQKNHEEIIRAAYVQSLMDAGIPAEEAKKTADSAQYRNQFKRAEIDACRAEWNIEGAITTGDLAEYVAEKYGPEYTVTDQGEIETAEVPLVYTLAYFKAEALAKENQYHLAKWSEKHKNRIKKHLANGEEIAELNRFISDRLAALRGDPPVPEEPPQDVVGGEAGTGIPKEKIEEEESVIWQLAVEFDALCTEDQIKQIAGAVSKILRSSPFVVDGSCKMVTR